jgi:hypothetical protein
MVVDTSGNNLHGRLVGNARVYADPERGSVLRLDGEGGGVDCGADARFDMTDEIAVAVWIKVGVFDKAWQAIIAKGGNTWRLQRAPAMPWNSPTPGSMPGSRGRFTWKACVAMST